MSSPLKSSRWNGPIGQLTPVFTATSMSSALAEPPSRRRELVHILDLCQRTVGVLPGQPALLDRTVEQLCVLRTRPLQLSVHRINQADLVLAAERGLQRDLRSHRSGAHDHDLLHFMHSVHLLTIAACG